MASCYRVRRFDQASTKEKGLLLTKKGCCCAHLICEVVGGRAETKLHSIFQCIEGVHDEFLKMPTYAAPHRMTKGFPRIFLLVANSYHRGFSGDAMPCCGLDKRCCGFNPHFPSKQLCRHPKLPLETRLVTTRCRADDGKVQDS